MVVINGDKMKEKDHQTGATSESKLKEIKDLETSNFASGENEAITEAIVGTNIADGTSEENLYDDVSPVSKASSNGGMDSSPMCVIESSSTVVNTTPPVEDHAKPDNTPTIQSDLFGQLVSDTLLDSELDGPAEKEVVASVPHETEASIQQQQDVSGISQQLLNSAKTPLRPQAVVAPQRSEPTAECNGDDGSVSEGVSALDSQEDPPHQGELSFRQEALPLDLPPDGAGSENVFQQREDQEVDDEEEYGEHDSEEEFDEDEYRAAKAQLKKATHGSKDGAGQKDSSIMVIDSDEDEDDEEDCDDEQDEHIDEEEEEEDDEDDSQLEEEEEMDYRKEYPFEAKTASSGTAGKSQHQQPQRMPANLNGSNNGDISLPNRPGPMSSKARANRDEQSDHSSHKYRSQGNEYERPAQSNNIGRKEASEEQRNSGAYQNLGRDHSSLMKKIKYTQELDSLKRRGILVNTKNVPTSDEEMDESWTEDDGWEELQKWNETRERESKQKTQTLSKANRQLSNPTDKNPISTWQHPSHKLQQMPVHEPPLMTNDSDKWTRNDKQHNSQRSSSKHVGDAETTQNQPSTSRAAAAAVPASPIPADLVPLLNEAKGYFEIGHCVEDDPELTLHMLSITIIFAKGLDKVVPGAILRSCRQGPYFSYSLVGCPVNTDPINDISCPQFPAERANAKVLATDGNMKRYFSQHRTLHITLMIGEIQLAKCSVDLEELCVSNEQGDSETKKIQGAYTLIPEKGNMAAAVAMPAADALLGLSVELERMPLPAKTIKAESSNTSLKEEQDRQHMDAVTAEYASLSRKRPRRDSCGSEASQSRDDSLALSAARKQVKKHLTNPPLKKRKLTEAGDKTKIMGTDEDDIDTKKSQFWEEAEEDLKNWRQAQENIFWKQWLVREKKLQDSLSAEWRQRMEGLEDELQQQMLSVEEERAALEDQWRSLRDREQRCNRREEQLLELQEDVLQQQAALGSALRFNSGAAEHSQPSRLAIRQRHSPTPQSAGGAAADHKQYYKSQWLRGVATTHRRWAGDRGAGSSTMHSSRLSTSPPTGPSTSRSPADRTAGTARRFSSSFRGHDADEAAAAVGSTRDCASGSSARRPSTAGKYDTDIIEEISRLTKERRELLINHLPDSHQVVAIDKTIQQLMDASGV